jgi:hypothetical protein
MIDLYIVVGRPQDKLKQLEKFEYSPYYLDVNLINHYKPAL